MTCSWEAFNLFAVQNCEAFLTYSQHFGEKLWPVIDINANVALL